MAIIVSVFAHVCAPMVHGPNFRTAGTAQTDRTVILKFLVYLPTRPDRLRRSGTGGPPMTALQHRHSKVYTKGCVHKHKDPYNRLTSITLELNRGQAL